MLLAELAHTQFRDTSTALKEHADLHGLFVDADHKRTTHRGLKPVDLPIRRELWSYSSVPDMIDLMDPRRVCHCHSTRNRSNRRMIGNALDNRLVTLDTYHPSSISAEQLWLYAHFESQRLIMKGGNPCHFIGARQVDTSVASPFVGSS